MSYKFAPEERVVRLLLKEKHPDWSANAVFEVNRNGMSQPRFARYDRRLRIVDSDTGRIKVRDL